MLARYVNGGRPVEELKVTVPPAMNKMEQLLAVQNAISQAEELVQEGNVVLLKIRGLLLSIFPQVITSLTIHALLAYFFGQIIDFNLDS